MIRLTRVQFEQLRSGKRLEVPCPRRQRAGLAYKAIVQAVTDGDGNEVHARALRTVTIVEKPSDMVAIIAWSDQTDTPRFLHRDSSRGYTREPYQALHDEAEAVPESVQDAYCKEAQAKPRTAQREVWAERRAEWQRQLDELRATETGAHVARDLAAIESRLRAIDRKLAA